MIDLIRNIFAGPQSAGKMLDAVIKTGDKLFYTDEEKSEMSAKARDWYLKYLETTQPQNLARRLIAIIVSAVWGLFVLIGGLAWNFDPEYSDFMLVYLSETVNLPFSIIIGFYFGGHALQKLVGGDKK